MKFLRILLPIFAFSLVGWLAASCVQMAVSPEPRYPLRHYDYTHDENSPEPPPWTDAENYPAVQIIAPANGSFVAPGAVAVSGAYEGPEATMLLNGQPVTLTPAGDNKYTFAGQITVAESDTVVPVKATATTTETNRVSSDLSTVFTGAATPPAGATTNAVTLDLENSGLQAIGAALAKLLGSLNLAEAVNAQLDLTKTGGETVSKSVLNGVAVQLQSTANGLQIGLSVQNIDIEFAFIKILIDDVSAQMVANISFDANHKATVTLTSSSVRIGSLHISNPIIDEVVSYVAGLVIDTVVKLLVPGLLADLLDQAKITITATGFTFALLPAVAAATDRNFVFGFDDALTVTDPTKWNADFQPAGYRSISTTAPEFPAKTPLRDAAYGLGVGANYNALNQLLYGLCATNTLQFEVTDPVLTARLFSVLFFSFSTIPGGTPLIVRFAPTVAPIAASDSVTGLTNLVFPAYTASILVDNGEATPFEALTFAVNLTAPLTVQVNDDGSFSLLLGELQIGLEVIHNAVGQRHVENMDRLFLDLFETVVPNLLSSLSSMKISLPVLAGMQISVADLAAFGANDNYLGIFVELK